MTNNDESLRFICALGNPEGQTQSRSKALGDGLQVHFCYTSRCPDSRFRPNRGWYRDYGKQNLLPIPSIGSYVVIYLNCSITHDVCVGDFCSIAPGCNLSGASILEEGVELGTGVSVSSTPTNRGVGDYWRWQCGYQRHPCQHHRCWNSLSSDRPRERSKGINQTSANWRLNIRPVYCPLTRI